MRVNALAPSAATTMTQGVFSEKSIELLQPKAVTPGVLFLANEQAPSRLILCAGGGVFARTTIAETEGIFLAPDMLDPDAVATNFDAIIDTTKQRHVRDARN